MPDVAQRAALRIRSAPSHGRRAVGRLRLCWNRHVRPSDLAHRRVLGDQERLGPQQAVALQQLLHSSMDLSCCCSHRRPVSATTRSGANERGAPTPLQTTPGGVCPNGCWSRAALATAHAATGLAALLGEVDLLQGVLLDTAKARACSCIAPEPRLLQSCIPQHEARPHR